MAVDLGTTLLTVAASFEAINNAERAVGRYQQRLNTTSRATEGADSAQQRLNRAFTGVTRTSQLVLGPLSGIASRLGNIQSVLNSGTVALAAFTTGLSALIATTVSAARLFQEVEVDLLGIQSILKATGKSTNTSVNQVTDAIEKFSTRAAVPLQESMKAAQAALTFRGIDTKNLEEFLITASGLSQAFGDSLISASVAIGKAIESPASALEALAEKGLARFTTEQKKVMQSWADAGDNARVYAEIVGAVQKKVGDAGDATGSYAVTLNKLSIAWFKFRMRIFQGSEAAGEMEGIIEKVTQKLKDWTKAGSVADQIGIIIERTANGIGNAMDFLGRHMDKIIIAFKVWASAKVVGLAVSSMLTFEAALITGVRAIGNLGSALRTLPRLFTPMRGASGIVRPFQVLINLVAPLKGVVLVLAGLAGAFTAFGAANVNTGNAILDVWVSVLAFWQTLKSRLVAGWDFLSKNVKILAENVSTKFNTMFPNFAEELKEIRDFARNAANAMLFAFTKASVAVISTFDHLKKSFKELGEQRTLVKNLKEAESVLEQVQKKASAPDQDVFVKLGGGRTGKVFKTNLQEATRELEKASAAYGAFVSQDPLPDFLSKIEKDIEGAIAPTVGEFGEELAKAGKILSDSIGLTPLIEFVRESGANFTEDFKKNLKRLEAEFKIKVPVEPDTEWDKFFAAANDEVKPQLSELAQSIKDQLNADLEDFGKSVAQALAHQLITGENVDWTKIGQTIGEQVAEGLIQKLIIDKSVAQLQGGVESLFQAGLNFLSPGNGGAVASTFAGSVGSPESTLGSVLPTLNQAMGPSANVPFAAQQTVNNFNITTPNPETFRQARGRVIGSMQNQISNR